MSFLFSHVLAGPWVLQAEHEVCNIRVTGVQLRGEKFTEGTEDLALTLEIGLSLSRLLVVTLSVRLQQRLQRVGGCPHLSVQILEINVID